MKIANLKIGFLDMNYFFGAMQRIIVLFLLLSILSCEEKPRKYDNVVVKKSGKTKSVNKNESQKDVKAALAKNIPVMFFDSNADIFLEPSNDDSVRIVSVGEPNSKNTPVLKSSSKQIIFRNSNPDEKGTWRVQVPDSILLNINSSNGNIHAKDILGVFTLRAKNDVINFENTSGAYDIQTDGGSMTFTDNHFMGRSVLISRNGDVDISLQGDVEFPLNVHSGSGNVNISSQGHEWLGYLEIVGEKGVSKLELNGEPDTVYSYISGGIEIPYQVYGFNLQNKNIPQKISTGTGKVKINFD